MQNYTTVVVPKMEEAFKNLGAKYESDPDVAIIFSGVSQMNGLLQRFFQEGTQLQADHAQAIQGKQELDSALLEAVAELSVQTAKVKGLSKKAIQDVNTYLKTCTTIVVDEENERKANEFLVRNRDKSATEIETKIRRHESDIQREQFAIKKASSKLPTLVLENAALHKLKKMRERKDVSDAKRLSEAAKCKAKIEALKQEERVAKLKQSVESNARVSLLDYEDDYEAPRLADFVDDEAEEAKFDDSDYEAD
jgi:hypothetical protein